MESSELQFWTLVGNASLPVKGIMLILGVMLIAVIFLIWKKWIILKITQHNTKRFERLFWSGADINLLAREALEKGKGCSGLEAIFLAGFQEFSRLRHYVSYGPEYILESTKSAMFAAIQREEAHLERSLSWIATTGSVAPYIGLLGTVIGVMNSFVALGGVQQVTLAQVAPGISEALVATAVGLLAAIPAVMAFNKFSNDINKLMTQHESFVDEFANILARQYLQIRTHAARQQQGGGR